MEKKVLEVPVFFPSASRVKIPFVGDDTRYVKPYVSNVRPPSNPLERHQKNVENVLLKQVSHGLQFDIEVLKERGAHTLPYDENAVMKAYDLHDIALQHARVTSSGGRFDTRGYRKKVPSQFKILASPRASEMKFKRRTVAERHGEIPPMHLSSESISKTPMGFSDFSPVLSKGIFDGTLQPYSVEEQKQLRTSEWDEYVINQISKDTARWIVAENVETGVQKDRLTELLKKKFGTKISNTNLIREDGKESDFAELERKKAEKLKKLLDEKKRAKKFEKINEIQNDPVLSQTFAQYYKLPRYLKQKRRLETNPLSDINQSAHNIDVKHFEPPPPPKMKDFLNPAVGDYFYATDNAFEQQLYTNQAKPVYRKNGDKTRIIMNDLSEYQCNLKSIYPPHHANWSDEQVKNHQYVPKSERPVKGLQRWKKLPNPADFASELGLNLPRCEAIKKETLELSKKSHRLENAPMIHIIEEWRSKWKLAGKWQEVTLADVLLDMDSLHSHVRLGAVAACAVAALHKLPVEEASVLAILPKLNASVVANKTEVGHLYSGLLDKVRQLLDDEAKRVQLASAMCLYTLSEITPKVVEILEYNLENGIPTDRMACAQCLALKGRNDSKVVNLIIQMLLETDEQEQATALLAHLSQSTRLVHSLLAEQLNSCCWKDKVIACNVLSELSGNINRDLVHKLSNLMWEDWSSEVRNAAARTLGRTGHGRDIHFDLREKLVRGNELVCADVLRKIGHLRIMTAALLPEFLKCFNAEYVSVRLEAVRAATILKIHEPKVTRELVRLTEFDPAWKIKAYSIKALGEIGITSDKIMKALVWALRFENEPGIRMEACVALRKLNLNQPEVLHVLQDRVLVEPDALVKKEVKETLVAFGMTGPEDNMEMVRQIKKEVKKLSRKDVVAAKVMLYEKELDKFQRKAQYIGTMDDDVSSQSESDDVVDLEISRALKRRKSTGRNTSSAVRTISEVATPLITFTPGTPLPDRPYTSDTQNTDIPILTITDDSADTPPTGESKLQVLPEPVCS